MAAKKVVVGAWLWWVVVGSAVLGFSWGFRSPKLFHTQSAMVQGRVVMLFPIMNGCRGLQGISFFRSGGGVLAASYSKGKLPSMVGALWSGRACGLPCVVGIENEGIALLSGKRGYRAFVWLPGGSVRYYPAVWPRLYPYSYCLDNRTRISPLSPALPPP